MVRIEELDITFFHLPKNAGSSIEKWLVDNVGGEAYLNDLRHTSPQSVEPMFGDFGWSFCCVRNPWDRMVSWYNFFKGQGKINISFEDFMKQSFEGEPTAKYIKPIDRQLRTSDYVDYVIRYENLEDGFKLVQDMTECHVPLGKHNTSKRSDYALYYTDKKLVDYVGEYYYDEISQFGYSF
jgi:hypothetical protein